jgi:hypothetical protein
MYEYKGEKHTETSIIKIDSNNAPSKLINTNILYIDYLFKNFTIPPDYDYLKTIKDTNKMQEVFISNLLMDTTFNSIMKKFLAPVYDKKNFTPDTLSIEELLDIAVKFIYVKKSMKAAITLYNLVPVLTESEVRKRTGTHKSKPFASLQFLSSSTMKTILFVMI